MPQPQQIVKPSVKQLQQMQSEKILEKQPLPQPAPVTTTNHHVKSQSSGNVINQYSSNSKDSKREIEEVMNLPDNLGGKKKSQISGLGPSLNDEILKDIQRKNILKHINQKFATPSSSDNVYC